MSRCKYRKKKHGQKYIRPISRLLFRSDTAPSTTGGFGGFGSLSVGDKPAAAGPPKNPFQTTFGGDNTSNEQKRKWSGQYLGQWCPINQLIRGFLVF